MQVALPGMVGHCDVFSQMVSSFKIIGRQIETLRLMSIEAFKTSIEQSACTLEKSEIECIGGVCGETVRATSEFSCPVLHENRWTLS